MQPESKPKYSMKQNIEVIVIALILAPLIALAVVYFAQITDPSAILGIFALFFVLCFICAVATLTGAVPDYV